jgi:hypothetical protein
LPEKTQVHRLAWWTPPVPNPQDPAATEFPSLSLPSTSGKAGTQQEKAIDGRLF